MAIRNLFFALALLAQSTVCLAQYWDYHWVAGYPDNVPGFYQIGGTLLHYNGQGFDTSRFDTKTWFRGSAYISDATGAQLLMYANGCKIMNRNHELMQNGDELSISASTYEAWCGNNYGLPSKGQLILPDPGSNKTYKYFYLPNGGNDVKQGVLMATVDMELVQGLGVVIEKNIPLTQDSLMEYLNACRHANGRDWWVIVCGSDGRSFYKYLWSPEGIRFLGKQFIGAQWKRPHWGGKADISQDGKKYARSNPTNGTDIYDFDRCNGKLTHRIQLNFPKDTSWYSNITWSPSGRYLYFIQSSNVWQVDTEASQPISTLTKVAEYDGFQDPFDTRFFSGELGPDEKIYIGGANGVPWLHVIHQPDLPGVACDLRQHDFKTPTYILQHFSNFPNFRLFDEPGSPCDTLGVDGYVAVDEIENGQDEVYVFPNPLRRGDQCYVKSTARWYRAEFWSVDGRLIEIQDLDLGIGVHGLPVSAGLSAGVYVLKLLGPNGVIVAKKLLVME